MTVSAGDGLGSFFSLGVVASSSIACVDPESGSRMTVSIVDDVETLPPVSKS